MSHGGGSGRLNGHWSNAGCGRSCDSGLDGSCGGGGLETGRTLRDGRGNNLKQQANLISTATQQTPHDQALQVNANVLHRHTVGNKHTVH